MSNDNSTLDQTRFGNMQITSRYSDGTRVKIDVLRVPELFRHLVSAAKLWAIGDDEERLRFIRLTPRSELESLITAVQPLDDAIWNWCRSHHQDIPVPDEVVVFDGLLQAIAEARLMLE